MCNAKDRLMIEHLDKAVKLLTEENEELKDRIERQAAYHASEVAALQQKIRDQKALTDKMHDQIVRAAML